jgi:serine/threonine protein kinase
MEKQLILNNITFIKKKKIGCGYTSKVYIIEEIKSNKIYACKLIEDDKNFNKEVFSNEINCLSTINNNNIIKIIDSGKVKWKKGNKEIIKFFIILEYCENGNLYNYIFKGFGEFYGKFLFNKILDAVNEIHKQGYCHRDLKTGNILLDKDFNIKIADFGFSKLLSGKEGDNKLKTPLGTKFYCAPEVYKNKLYNGIKSDIFSLGVLLYVIVTGKTTPTNQNNKYEFRKQIKNKKYKEKSFIEKYFKGLSTDFIDLFIKMINYVPNERPNYSEIKEHNWLQNIEVTNEEMKNEFLRRDFYVKNKIEEEEIIKAFNNNEKNENNENNENNDDYDEDDGKLFRRESGLKEFFSYNNKIKIVEENEISNLLKLKILLKIQNEMTFMNLITNQIYKNEKNNEKKDEIKENLNIITSKKFLSFKFIYQFEDEDDDDDDLNENIEMKNLTIKIEFVKNENNIYYFLFKKKSGEYEEFLPKIQRYKKIIKTYIEKNFM